LAVITDLLYLAVDKVEAAKELVETMHLEHSKMGKGMNEPAATPTQSDQPFYSLPLCRRRSLVLAEGDLTSALQGKQQAAGKKKEPHHVRHKEHPSNPARFGRSR
jgi:hypothetical protein